MKQSDNILWWNLRLTNIIYTHRHYYSAVDKACFKTTICMHRAGCTQARHVGSTRMMHAKLLMHT